MTEKDGLEIRELTLLNGISYPSDEELVMLILGSGTRKKPVELLAGEVMDVIYKTDYRELVKSLLKIEGIGFGKALAISAALELGRRHNRNPQAFVSTPTDVVPFVKHYAMQPTEHFVCITVNGAREIIEIHLICTGSGNRAVMKPREIFCDAVKERASGVILCHNHPAGICSPSEDDIRTTQELYKAAKLLGIALLDHIIITKNEYFSFLEHNMLSYD